MLQGQEIQDQAKKHLDTSLKSSCVPAGPWRCGGLQYHHVVPESSGVDHAVQDSGLYVQADL